jgi:uncharacterized protein YeaO (DUF488 family)
MSAVSIKNFIVFLLNVNTSTNDLMRFLQFGSLKIDFVLEVVTARPMSLKGNSSAGATSMSEEISNERVKLKRAYESPAADDGMRVLVDRLWPRGVKKTEAAIDHWMKELAPSTELRKWFGHDPARWEEFRRRYAAEIHEHRDDLDRLRGLIREGTVTLVYSAHDEAHNDAVVLREILLTHR